MIQAKLLPLIESLGLDETGWNTLAEQSETNTVFQTHQWVSSWDKVYGRQYEQWCISVSDATGIMGVAPLMVKRGFFGERVVMFVGEGKADYADILSAGDKRIVLEAICNVLFEARERWDVLELNNIPAESSTVELMQEIVRDAGCRTLQRDLYQSPTLLIRGHEDEALGVFNKAGLRRRQNYFQRKGRLTFKTLTGRSILSCLDEFFDQHISRWKGSGTPSLFLQERNRTFYRELALAMAKNGWLLMSVVELDGRPLAMHYGFDYNGKLLWYKPSFDPAHAKHSPGLVLLRHMIGYAIDNEREELDFTIGDEPFKSRFANHTRKTIRLQIFQDPVHFAVAWSRQKLGAVKRKLESL